MHSAQMPRGLVWVGTRASAIRDDENWPALQHDNCNVPLYRFDAERRIR